MTDEELGNLIYGTADWLDLTRGQAIEIARDALRFRHITRNAEHAPDPEPYPGQPTRYGWSVQWGVWGDQHTTLREAIDQDMRNQE